ncbi:AgrD family cyclic lactone autoinducer peptide [Variovorax sp. EL159]
MARAAPACSVGHHQPETPEDFQSD